MNYFLFSAIDCRNCGNLIWAGHSSTGIPTKLDPTQLNLLAEITAKLTGLRTYQIHRLGRTFEATPRVAARMWAKNAIVLAQHQCRPISIFGEVPPRLLWQWWIATQISYLNRWDTVLVETEQLTCNICLRPSRNEGACFTCRFNLSSQLIELPALQVTAGEYLTPGRSGSGSPSTERSIGINVSALDFSMATELLAILHGWEQIIRAERQLTPPALVAKEHTTDLEVEATCKFHLAHLDWTLGQDWVKDFAGEVKELHSKGMAAAQKFKEQPRRIPCPTDDCRKFIIIDVENLKKDVTCHGCKNSWTVIRLIALAMSNPNRRFYLDIEAIALWLGISQQAVYKMIKSNPIPQKGKLFDLAAIIKMRDKTN